MRKYILLCCFIELTSRTQVTPWNPLLFLCHFVNEGAQLGQGYRFVKYHYIDKKAPAEPVDAAAAVESASENK